MGEPSRAEGWLGVLEPSGVSQPSGVLEPSEVLTPSAILEALEPPGVLKPLESSGVPEPLRVPKSLEPSEVLEPSGVSQPSGILKSLEVSGVPEPPGVSQPSEVLEFLGVPEPPGVSQPSEVLEFLGVPGPSGVLKPSEVLGVPDPLEPPGVLQPTPPPEVLEGLLQQRFGALPRAAAIARLRRGPAGAYEASREPGEALQRRQAANAKERERIRNLNSGFSRLRALVPLVPRDRRPSKADTLRAAAQYIRLLRDVLRDCQELGTEQELGGTAGGHPEPGLAVPPRADPPSLGRC